MVEQQRSKQGNIASLIGILTNVLLAGAKIAVGLLFGMLSVLADGLNNLTDCGSNVISMVSFKLSSKPADKEHPYGHERIEYICSLAVAVMILLVAFEILKESISKITNPTQTPFSIWIIIVLSLSILAKLGLYVYYNVLSRKINSSMLKATAIDSLSDCLSTFLTLVAFIISILTGFNIDGYAGLLVSLFIGFSAINILREIFSMLIGKAPDSELLSMIKDKVSSYPGVLGVHDLAVYSYGPNKYYASIHVEVDANTDVLVSHELVDLIEKEFLEQTGIILTGHLDPVVIDDDRVNCLRKQMEQFICELHNEFSMHDFRMVFGENRTNVLFDLAIPYDCKFSKEEITEILEHKLNEIDDKYCLVLTVERTF